MPQERRRAGVPGDLREQRPRANRADPVDDETSASNTATAWENLQVASNGCRWGQVVSGGEFTGMYFMVNWTDSLDAFMEASKANFADPRVQQVMSDSNARPGPRSLSRHLA